MTTVINTHFHFDHAHGNQIFEPNVQIIGHEFTRRMLLSNSIGMPLYQGYLTGMPGQIDDAEEAHRRREADPAAKAKLQTQLQVTENNYASQKELKPTPPNVTLSTQMTLYRGTREIQIRYLGRGHTAGDVVVLLPNEKVVMTGDFLTSGLSNMSDSYPGGVGRVARRAEEARLRHRASRATATRSPTRRRSTTSRPTCATCGAKSAA